MVGGRSERGSRRHAAAASVVVPFPRDAAGARLDLVRFVPSGRSLLATFGVLVAIGLAYWLAYSTPVFAVTRSRCAERRRARARGVARDGRPHGAEASWRSTPARSRATLASLAGRRRCRPSTAPSRTRSSSGSRPSSPSPSSAAAFRLARHRGRQGRSARSTVGTQRGAAATLARPRRDASGSAVRFPQGLVSATRALADAALPGSAVACTGVRTTGDELTLVLRHGTEVRLGRAADVLMKLVIARHVLATRRRRRRRIST